MLRANLQRTGVYETRGIAKLPRVKWQFNTGRPHISPPVIRDDWVYFGSIDGYSNGYFFALNLQTGEERWKTKPGGLCAQIEGDTLYCRGLGDALALERTTGQERKRWSLKYGGWGGPVVVGDSLYYGSLNRLYAFSIPDNEQKWRCGTNGYGPAHPTFVEGNRLFFGSYGGRLYSVNINSGRKRWTFKASERINRCAVVFENCIYFGCEHGNFHALDIRTGKAVWEFLVGGVITDAAVTHDLVCFGIWDGRVVALNRLSGSIHWTFKTEGAVPSSPSIVEGIVYFGDGDFKKKGGRVYALDLKTGQEIWRFETRDRMWSAPVISDGVLYIGSGDGHLYALEE